MRRKKPRLAQTHQALNETDFTRRCFCAVQYQKGESSPEGTWSPDHIHIPKEKSSIYFGRVYYCGECNMNHSIDLAIENKNNGVVIL